MQCSKTNQLVVGLFLLPLFLLVSCAPLSTPKKPSTQSGGGYYSDDGPPLESDIDINAIADATPKVEPRSKTGNKPYTVFGKRYHPISSSKGFEQRGVASWYGKKYHGRRTSSGEVYDMTKMTAAHPTLPLPTYVEVTNLDNNKKVVVKVNDRGPFLNNRVLDLSYVAARKLGIVKNGVGRVYIRAIDPATPTISEQLEIEQPVASIVTGTTDNDYSEKYVIQVGAFADKNNAEVLRKRLTDYGYTLYLQQNNQKSDSLQLYPVIVGPYASVNIALEQQAQLNNLLNTSTLLQTAKP